MKRAGGAVQRLQGLRCCRRRCCFWKCGLVCRWEEEGGGEGGEGQFQMMGEGGEEEEEEEEESAVRKKEVAAAAAVVVEEEETEYHLCLHDKADRSTKAPQQLESSI
jgi:hypothetical protein